MPTLRAQERRFGLASVSPTVLVVLLVVLLPVIWTVVLSFRTLRLSQLQRVNLFAGELSLANYREVLADSFFWDALQTTFVFGVLGTLGAVALGLAAALSLTGRFRGRGALRGLILVPYVMPVVASTLLWKIMLNPQFGLVNAVGERLLGWANPVPFLSQQSARLDLLGFHIDVPLALSTVVAFEIWKTFPFCYLFLLARLQAIPGDLDEAARLDGATPTQRFWYVVLPQLRGVLAILLFLRFIWTFQSFNEIYLLTGGAGGTEVLSTQIYDRLVNDSDVGGAAALGVVLAAVMAGALFLYYRGSLHKPGDADA